MNHAKQNGTAAATLLVGYLPLDAGAAKQNGSAASTPLVGYLLLDAGTAKQNGVATATPLISYLPLDAKQNGSAVATPLVGYLPPDAGAAKQNGSAAATPLAPLDADEFRQQGRLVVDFIADYYSRIHQYPVRPTVAPGFLAGQFPDAAPLLPEPNAFAPALRDVRELILPGITHWQSPHQFAHFAATASNVGALGETLAAGLNINPFTWVASPAATKLEVVVTDWLGKALNLPRQLLFCGGGGGTLVGTSCEAMLCTIIAARNSKLAEIGEEWIGDLVVYCSDKTHFSFIKVGRIAGIRRDNRREIPACREGGFALWSNALRAAVLADEASGRVPLFLCANVGTTPTAAIDPIRELCAAVAGHDVWVHVDVAYAGAACVCPEFHHTIDGAEDVDFVVKPLVAGESGPARDLTYVARKK